MPLMTLRLVLLLMMAVEVKSMDLLGKFLVNMSAERVMRKLHHHSPPLFLGQLNICLNVRNPIIQKRENYILLTNRHALV